jgi:hypothetical protein
MTTRVTVQHTSTLVLIFHSIGSANSTATTFRSEFHVFTVAEAQESLATRLRLAQGR